MFPINEKAGMWHFWLTSAGLLALCFSFWRLAQIASSGDLKASRLNSAAAWAQLASIPLLLAAQAIFIVKAVGARARFQKGRQ